MEMNGENVARYKRFHGKPSFVPKKKTWMIKSRFGEIATEEIKKIMDNAVPVTTKKLQSSRTDYLTVRIHLVSFKRCKMKYERRDFTHS